MNYTSWENVTTMNDLLGVANTNSGGVFWAGMLYTFVVILFMALLFTGVEQAAMVALFIGIIVGSFLLYMNLIGGTILGILVGALVAVIIYAVFSSYKSNYT